MTLDQLQPGQKARIADIEGGQGLRSRLGQMGIHPGDTVSVSQRGAFRGPFLVVVHGSRVAIGRGVARRVHVEITVADPAPEVDSR